jgi:hypothetical protein
MADLGDAQWVHDGPPPTGVVEADAQARADEVTRIMHELGHEEIDPAVIHALLGCATHAIVTISNMVYASHGPDAAGQIMGGWNLFVEAVHPYYLTEPCQHHSWDQPGEPPVPH